MFEVKVIILLDIFNLVSELVYGSIEGQRWYLCQCASVVFPGHTHVPFWYLTFQTIWSYWLS